MSKNPFLTEIAHLLMYCGPSIEETISEAIHKGNHFAIVVNGEITKLSICSTTAYSLSVEDVYFYDVDKKLIKQTLLINGNEKVVFDKYAEVNAILEAMERTTVQVS